MAIRIGSNTTSLLAQRLLADSSGKLSSVFERLSSGSRINKASDDAAGLAIADTLSMRSKVYVRGVQNINDGISVISIADAAVGALSNITIRIVELAEQSINGTYTNKQREAMDKEAQALKKEYFRIANSATFNGIRLFDGSLQGLSLQAGEGASAVLSSSLGGKMGTGGFGGKISIPGNGDYAALGDLNRDGILDMVTIDSGDDEAMALLGNGDGTFRLMNTVSTGWYPSSIKLGDLNGDGDLDMITADYDSFNTSVFLGNGDGTFGKGTTFATGREPKSVALGDLNGDSILDVVTANVDSDDVSVLLGRGDGTFRARTDFATGNGSYSVALGDLNGDNILDIVTANYAATTASVLLGKGDGTFAAQTAYTIGSSASFVSLGDLNGDSILDMVTANRLGSNASVLLGNGDGTFKAQTLVTTGTSPFCVTLGDLNGDDILDLLTADALTGASVLIGNGDGTFRARTSLGGFSGPRFVALGDLNGDGVLDVVEKGDSVHLGSTRDGIAPILPFSLKTKADALQALMPLKKKLESLTAQRGVLGAFEATLASARGTLTVSAENFRAAESRIRDTDVATDAAQMTRLRILKDAGAAVLGQANQQPQIALQLLNNR